MSIAAFSAGGAISGSGSGISPYVDDNFKVINYLGTGAARTIETDGLTGLNTTGCMIWIFGHANTNNSIYDTNIGVGNYINPATTAVQTADTQAVTAFTSTGFSLGTSARVNTSGVYYYAYVFKRSPTSVMDMLAFNANGSSTTVSHGLGAMPGMIILKRYSGTAQNWMVWHQSRPTNKVFFLNSAEDGSVQSTAFTSVTSTSFTFGSYIDTQGGANYVAYVFPTNSNVVCSGYTGNGSTTGPSVNVGFEPGFTLNRTTTYAGTAYWCFQDKLRGFTSVVSASGTANPAYLHPGGGVNNLASYGTVQNGFKVQSSAQNFNFNTADYMFMAIRQTNKPASELPTSGFFNTLRNSAISNTSPRSELFSNIGFDPDMVLFKSVGSNTLGFIHNRDELNTVGTVAYSRDLGASNNAVNDAAGFYFDRHHAVTYGGALSAAAFQGYFFKKTVGFFDITTYVSPGSPMTVPHNLGAVPELMIIRSATGADTWQVYFAALGNTSRLLLNVNDAVATGVSTWNSTTPTSTNFYVGDFITPSATCASGTSYLAYLFASVPGKVKIGSYTGNGAANQNIDCGFSTGARFVLAKPSTTTANWYVCDTTQGINAGADGYWQAQAALAMTGTGSGVDLIDTYSAGFSVTNVGSGLNENGHTYVYMAIA